MRLLRRRLEKDLSVTIEDDKIWEAIELMNRENGLAQAIADLNRAEPPLMSGMQLLTVLWSRGFNIDKQEVIGMLEGLLQDIQNRQPLQTGQPRVLLTGCPIGLGTEKIITLVENLGGNVVALENCTGYKTVSLRALREQEDPVIALARKYIQIPCSCMSPNEGRARFDLKPVKGGDTPYLQQQNYSLAALDERDRNAPLATPQLPPPAPPDGGDDEDPDEGERGLFAAWVLERELRAAA